MARKKTIGILNAIVMADAAQLRKEFKSVDNTIRRSTMSWQKQLKGGLKLGLGFAGASSALSLLGQEIKAVVMEVEKIPGVPPTAVASIQDLRMGVSGLRTEWRKTAATLLGEVLPALQAVGAGAAMLGGASADDVASGLAVQETPDQMAEGKDDQYWERVAAARAKLVEANKKAAMQGMSDAEQIAALREEAARFDRYAESRSINTLQRLEAETEAAERRGAADQKMAAMRKDLAAAEEKLGAASFGAARAKTNDAQAVTFLKDKTMQLQTELAELYRLMREDSENPEYLSAAIKKTNELTEVNKQLEKVLDRQNKRFERLGEELASSFEDATLSGGTLREMLHGIEQDIIRLTFRSLITEPLSKSIAGGLKDLFGGFSIGKLFGGFFAEGGRPPVGRPSIVGEKGPEVFVPDTAGTIVPNEKLGRFFAEGARPPQGLPGLAQEQRPEPIVPDAARSLVPNGERGQFFSQGSRPVPGLPSLISEKRPEVLIPEAKFGGFFAEGGRPPVGQPSIVGEKGPEVFVPDTAGTIVPNGKLGGGGNSGGTYFIDARGADRTGLARLEAMIRALHGSVEQRAVAAVADFRRRGAFA